MTANQKHLTTSTGIFKKLAATGAILLSLGICGTARAAVLNFDDLVFDATSYSYDADGDGIDDVVFSTSDPSGFNTVGPGPNMSYISEPGIEGTSLLANDLRVDFLVGATDYLKFAHALNSLSENFNTFTSFKVYDRNDNLLAEEFEYGLYTSSSGIGTSSYPEGLIETTFSGVASYALFDFSSDYGRYMIDNFEGTFGTTEVTVPEPSSVVSLLAFAAIGVGGMLKQKLEGRDN